MRQGLLEAEVYVDCTVSHSMSWPASRTLCLVCKDGSQDPTTTNATTFAPTEALQAAPAPWQIWAFFPLAIGEAACSSFRRITTDHLPSTRAPEQVSHDLKSGALVRRMRSIVSEFRPPKKENEGSYVICAEGPYSPRWLRLTIGRLSTSARRLA